LPADGDTKGATHRPAGRKPEKGKHHGDDHDTGVAIPRLGFGTFRMPGADAQPIVESAIALG
jgi:hypothetical protein